MTNIQKVILGLVVIVLVVVGYMTLKPTEMSVGTAVDCTSNTCFTSLGVTGTAQVDGAFITNGVVTNGGAVSFTSDATFNGGDGAIVVTTTNTATSSIEVGCVQMTATSTASPIKLVFSITATTTEAGPNGTTANGYALWKYGTCP